MRPGGLGSTQLIQKLAQLAWYWWPPYSSLKLSVSELNACQRERVKYVRHLSDGDNKAICAHRGEEGHIHTSKLDLDATIIISNL